MTVASTPTVDPTAASDDVVAEPRALTSHVKLGHVIMLVNPQSGSVGPNAAQEAESILSEYACAASVVSSPR